MIIHVKHGGAAHEVELSGTECPYKRIGALLGVAPARLTIIRAGKKLPRPGDPALQQAIVAGATYLVSGTRAEDALPSTGRRWLSDATAAASDLYARLTYDFCIAMLLWLWTLLISFGRACIAFVTSMVVAPDPARADRRARPPPAQNIAAPD